MVLRDELLLFGVTETECRQKIMEHLHGWDELYLLADAWRLYGFTGHPIIAKVLYQKVKDNQKYEYRQLTKWWHFLRALQGQSQKGKITEYDIEVARSVDLISLVGNEIELRRAGRGHFGRCPFHDEDTASLYIRDGFYYCFGCHTHGDAISWVMARQGTTFIDAVKILTR